MPPLFETRPGGSRLLPHSHQDDDASVAHMSAEMYAEKYLKPGQKLVEIRDERGEPCTRFPNEYSGPPSTERPNE